MQNGAAVDSGVGPPGGGPEGYALEELAAPFRNGKGKAPEDDAAFRYVDPLDKKTRARAELVVRELPLVQIQNTWSIDQARGALYAHMAGQFWSSGQLWDSIIGDPRIMATMGSRISGLFGRPVRFEPANDTQEAAECLEAWRTQAWPCLSSDAGLVEVHSYGIGMGFGHGQLVWDTTGPVWTPRVRPWHPSYNYFYWPGRRYHALTQGGEMPIVPGNGKWIEHSPFGCYRGWIHGAIRAIAEPWMLRHFAARDMARFSEVHGQPIRKAWTPAVADPGERSQFYQALTRLGAETTILLARGIDPQSNDGYDVELLEATDKSHEVFGQLIDRCDVDITLALLFQNLTTEVQGGSYAAANVHMDIRQSGLQRDSAAWKHTIHQQIARPFAYLNFGDPDLAPYTFWDVEPRDEFEANAKQFQQFGTAVEVLARGGIKFKDVEELRRFVASKFGLAGLPDFDIGSPPSSTGMGGFGK